MSEPIMATIQVGRPVKGSSPGVASRETEAAATSCVCLASSFSSFGLVTGGADVECGPLAGPAGGVNVPVEGAVVAVPGDGLVVVLGVVVVSCVVVCSVFVSDVVVCSVVVCSVVVWSVVVSSVVVVGVVPRQ
jgi:hypothetical protein